MLFNFWYKFRRLKIPGGRGIDYSSSVCGSYIMFLIDVQKVAFSISEIVLFDLSIWVKN